MNFHILRQCTTIKTHSQKAHSYGMFTKAHSNGMFTKAHSYGMFHRLVWQCKTLPFGRLRHFYRVRGRVYFVSATHTRGCRNNIYVIHVICESVDLKHAIERLSGILRVCVIYFYWQWYVINRNIHALYFCKYEKWHK